MIFRYYIKFAKTECKVYVVERTQLPRRENQF